MSDPQSRATTADAPPTPSLKTNVSLAAMMFLQYMLVAVWFVQLSAYLTNAKVEVWLKSLVLSSMAIGSMASPIICGLAGRYFASQKVLALANLVTAALLFCAAYFSQNPLYTAVFILLAMIAYMPSWALTSSIAMAHSSPKNFPQIRTFGTIGWVASGIFSFAAANGLFHRFSINGATIPEKIDGTTIPLFCGAAIALVAAFQNLTLPNTPPANDGEKFSLTKAIGLDAFALLKDRNYLTFIVGSFAAMIAFVLYFAYSAQFLSAKGFENITVTLNWGQAGEMILMFLTTLVLEKIGVKKALLIGLLAMALRYFFFYLGDTNDTEALYIAGILVHGFIFGWFFAGGQVYTAQKAPKKLLAQAQGMYAFLIWGIGVLVGTFIYGKLIAAQTVTTKVEDITSPAGITIEDVTTWSPLFFGTAVFSMAIFVFFFLFFKEEQPAAANNDAAANDNTTNAAAA